VLGEARTALALLHLQNQEGDAAVRHFRAALGVAPNSIDALDWLGRVMGEVGRIDEAFALLQKANAIEPEIVQARHQIARIRSMLGDSAGMLEALGPVPPHPGDIPSWFVIQARDLIWRRDVAVAPRLKEKLKTVALPPTAQFAIDHMLMVPLGNTAPLFDRAFLDRVLPIDASRSARRATFNAQMRAEMFAFAGAKDAFFEALRATDGNGLIDIVWLKRCPLFDPFRTLPEFTTVLERVASRAQRVASAIDSQSPGGL
jgi:serine/threonine-protein kinase